MSLLGVWHRAHCIGCIPQTRAICQHFYPGPGPLIGQLPGYPALWLADDPAPVSPPPLSDSSRAVLWSWSPGGLASCLAWLTWSPGNWFMAPLSSQPSPTLLPPDGEVCLHNTQCQSVSDSMQGTSNCESKTDLKLNQTENSFRWKLIKTSISSPWLIYHSQLSWLLYTYFLKTLSCRAPWRANVSDITGSRKFCLHGDNILLMAVTELCTQHDGFYWGFTPLEHFICIEASQEAEHF